MKKITILTMIILVMVAIAGCAGMPDSYTAESLHTVTDSTATENISPEPEDLREEKEEVLPEPETSVVNKSAAETTNVGTTSKGTSKPADNKPSSTSTPPKSPVTSTPPPAEPTEPILPVFTQQDYDEIIAAVRHYAENEITKIKFVWDPTKQMNTSCGWHGTPRLNDRGKDGVIKTLKFHADLTADVLTDQANGLTSNTVHYNIVRYEVENMFFFEQPCTSILFALVYG